MSRLGVFALMLALCACGQAARDEARPERTKLVLKMQPLWGNPAPFRALLDSFASQHPELELVVERIPNGSDLAHQFYLTELEGGSRAFDVLAIDTIWTAEFARAGWIAALSEAFPSEALRRDFLPGSVEAVVLDGQTFAVPWYVDVGLLYYRTDLVEAPPRTYDELAQAVARAQEAHPSLAGFVWQAKQYEGLTCNLYELIWGHGGDSLRPDGRLALDTEEARAALRQARTWLAKGISPPWMTSASEEETRRAFQDGRALFMRNWPYALAEAEKPGSKVRGRVAVAPLPSLSGDPGPSVLGGYQLALNAHTAPHKRKAALALIAHLTSLDANLTMAIHYARLPPRRAAYASERMREEAPFLAELLPVVERARPRPVTPYYVLLADILQSAFSGAVAGIRTPEDALVEAQRLADHLMKETP